MFLRKIELKNFRNYEDLKLEFNKNINIFIGNNAQGKTNILESIYFLAVTKSHRCNKDNYLIKNDCIFSKVIGEVENNDRKNIYEIIINNEGKRVSINNNIFKRISDYLSNINVVMFCPDDLEIIKGTPSDRRKFLNIEIGQISNEYIIYLAKFNKVLKTRNEYLKNEHNIDFNYLDILTDELIDLNIKLYKYRKEFINDLNNYIVDIYKKIFLKEDIYVKYESFIDNEEDIVEDLREKYLRVRDSELNQKTTLIGVHRDNFSIYIDGKEINNYGSQGQHRVAILCLKLAEIEIYKQKYNIKPIILLDDIFSELDKKKKINIIKYIDKDLQIFITSTDLHSISKRITKNADIFYIEEGKVKLGE
ncbi:MAG: DNA replication/repair protein RecF [Bacilli bacterium]|nr:DNA replication/repair protein RecF [Bacilli bacterium]